MGAFDHILKTSGSVKVKAQTHILALSSLSLSQSWQIVSLSFFQTAIKQVGQLSGSAHARLARQVNSYINDELGFRIAGWDRMRAACGLMAAATATKLEL